MTKSCVAPTIPGVILQDSATTTKTRRHKESSVLRLRVFCGVLRIWRIRRMQVGNEFTIPTPQRLCRDAFARYTFSLNSGLAQ